MWGGGRVGVGGGVGLAFLGNSVREVVAEVDDAGAAPPATRVSRKLRRDSRVVRLLMNSSVSSSYVRRILEHFECRLLQGKELAGETRNDAVEGCAGMGFYCVAQFISRYQEPTTEEPLLFHELELLLCNKVAHAVAQARDVVLGLGGFGAPREAERGELRAQGRGRRFVRKGAGEGRGVEGDRGSSGADEGAVCFCRARCAV